MKRSLDIIFRDANELSPAPKYTVFYEIQGTG